MFCSHRNTAWCQSLAPSLWAEAPHGITVTSQKWHRIFQNFDKDIVTCVEPDMSYYPVIVQGFNIRLHQIPSNDAINLRFWCLRWQNTSTSEITMCNSYAIITGMLFTLALKNKGIRKLFVFCFVLFLTRSFSSINPSCSNHYLPFSVVEL